MNEAPQLTVFTALAGLYAHIALDLLPLVLLAGILSLGFIERDKTSVGRGRGIAVLLAAMGVAFGIPAAIHWRLFSTLVALPGYSPIHHAGLAVGYAAAALPVAFLASKYRRASGWILVAGLVLWAPLLVQTGIFAVKGKGSVERIGLLRAAAEIGEAAEKLNPGALSRALNDLKVPTDPTEFDNLLYPTIIALLTHSNPEVARGAAVKIGERGRVDSIAPLVDARAEAAPVVKEAIDGALKAIVTKGESADELYRLILESKGKTRAVALDLLVKNNPAFLKSKAQDILRTGDEELRAAMTNLIKSGALAVQQDLVAPLIRSLSSNDQGERERALASLADLIAMPGVRERIDPKPILKILETGSPVAKRAAASLLLDMNIKDAVPLFVVAAASDDPELARIALDGILRNGKANDPLLFAKRVESENPALRVLAYRGLRESLPRNVSLEDSTVKIILKAAERENDLAAMRYAAILLAWIDAPNAYDYAEKLLATSASSENKLAVITAFDLIGEARAIKKLAELTKDGNPKIRAAAASTLGKIGDKSAEPALKMLLTDPDSEVREAAKLAIQELTAAPVPDPTPTPGGTTPTPTSTSEAHTPRPHEAPPGPVPW